MLDVNVRQSDNEVYICGLLREMEIIEGKTNDGREYVRGTMSIQVDQEIQGKMTNSIIPVKVFSMRKKKDGTINSMYDRILGYKDKFTSAIAVDDVTKASRVMVTKGSISENAWYNSGNDTMIDKLFQVNTNFLNKATDEDKEKATFRLSGIVGGIKQEMKNDEPTGRTIVSFIIVQYGGKVDIVDLIAEGNAADFINQNWEPKDTVQVAGRIRFYQKTEVRKFEQGFGEPIEDSYTVNCRELVITGGSPHGLEESLTYDNDSVKIALDKRLADHEALKTKSKATPKTKVNDFGW